MNSVKLTIQYPDAETTHYFVINGDVKKSDYTHNIPAGGVVSAIDVKAVGDILKTGRVYDTFNGGRAQMHHIDVINGLAIGRRVKVSNGRLKPYGGDMVWHIDGMYRGGNFKYKPDSGMNIVNLAGYGY